MFAKQVEFYYLNGLEVRLCRFTPEIFDQLKIKDVDTIVREDRQARNEAVIRKLGLRGNKDKKK